MQHIVYDENILFYDRCGRTYFESTMDNVKGIVGRINKKLFVEYGLMEDYSSEEVEEMISEELGFKTMFYDKVKIRFRNIPYGVIHLEYALSVRDDGRPFVVISWVYFYS